MSRKSVTETAAEQGYPITLRQSVQDAIRLYLEDMGHCQPDCLYQTLLAEVEPPLIEEVLRYTRGNQSQTAKILGITRNTLRTKLNRYDIPVTNGNWTFFPCLRDSRNMNIKPDSPKRLALISVSDKTGIIEFAEKLSGMGYGLLSTGGTAKALSEAGLAVTEVSDHTGSPEIMGGRVKTLHPRVHGGLLGRQGVDDAVMDEQDIPRIDMAVINLYPFESVTSQPDCSFEDAIENIDIGGPAMVRSAAKNFESVAVVTSPDQYEQVLEQLEARSARWIGKPVMIWRWLPSTASRSTTTPSAITSRPD